MLFFVLHTAVAACAATQPATGDTGALAPTSEPTLAYDARTGLWSEAVFSVLSGDELLHDGVLYRVTDDGLVERGTAVFDDLLLADLPYAEDLDALGLPLDEDWVYVLGDGPDDGHVRFADVVPGARFAWLGRVYTSRAVEGELQIRATGEVLSEVAATFVRHAPVLLDLTLELEDGSTSTLSVTEGHPFYVPGEDTYQPVGELAEGTVLRVGHAFQQVTDWHRRAPDLGWTGVNESD